METTNIIINALKFYYGEVLKKDFIYEVKRPITHSSYLSPYLNKLDINELSEMLAVALKRLKTGNERNKISRWENEKIT